MTVKQKALLALAFVSIAWGTTYFGIRVAVQHVPPYLFAGARQTLAGILMFGIAAMQKEKFQWSWQSIKQHAVVGLLLIAGGNGFVCWGEQHVESTVAAIICSMMPLFAVLFNIILVPNEKINKYIIAGLLLGFFGIAYMFKSSWHLLLQANYAWGVAALFAATMIWALGSIFNKRIQNNTAPLSNAGWQQFIGGCIMFVISACTEQHQHIDWKHAEVLIAYFYLVIVGSVMAYTFYLYTLRHLPIGIVTIYAYINPIVAIVLGTLFLKEAFNWNIPIAVTLIIGGILTVNWGYKQLKKNAQ